MTPAERDFALWVPPDDGVHVGEAPPGATRSGLDELSRRSSRRSTRTARSTTSAPPHDKKGIYEAWTTRASTRGPAREVGGTRYVFARSVHRRDRSTTARPRTATSSTRPGTTGASRCTPATAAGRSPRRVGRRRPVADRAGRHRDHDDAGPPGQAGEACGTCGTGFVVTTIDPSTSRSSRAARAVVPGADGERGALPAGVRGAPGARAVGRRVRVPRAPGRARALYALGLGLSVRAFRRAWAEERYGVAGLAAMLGLLNVASLLVTLG